MSLSPFAVFSRNAVHCSGAKVD